MVSTPTLYPQTPRYDYGGGYTGTVDPSANSGANDAPSSSSSGTFIDNGANITYLPGPSSSSGTVTPFAGVPNGAMYGSNGQPLRFDGTTAPAMSWNNPNNWGRLMNQDNADTNPTASNVGSTYYPATPGASSSPNIQPVTGGGQYTGQYQNGGYMMVPNEQGGWDYVNPSYSGNSPGQWNSSYAGQPGLADNQYSGPSGYSGPMGWTGNYGTGEYPNTPVAYNPYSNYSISPYTDSNYSSGGYGGGGLYDDLFS